MRTPSDVDPRFPADRSGVAILGCGAIARSAHLPAYQQHGVGVTGVWSRTPDRTAGVLEEFDVVRRRYETLEDLLTDPEVRIVDIATGPEGRLDLIEQAVAAGKHVLAQKPLTLDARDLARIPAVLAAARRRGVEVAVNHNARWAPAFRMATLLLRDGAVGEVLGVTHLHDKPLPPLAGTAFDDVPHMLLTDYLLHWADISRSWLHDGGARVVAVRASDSRTPDQPGSARNPWSATMELSTDTGATGVLRIVGNAVATHPGCPFWVHGTEGTLRGSVLLGSDRVSLDRGDGVEELPLRGAWFNDGFAAAMGELMLAIDEGREPENSALDAARSTRLVLAARESAERGAVVVGVDDGSGP